MFLEHINGQYVKIKYFNYTISCKIVNQLWQNGFQTALEEEVANKVHQLSDIVSGSPLVIKMIVTYYRGKGSLGELLGSLVRSVIDDKNLHINLVTFLIRQNCKINNKILS